MKICILSDSHDNRVILEQAILKAQELKAECVLHCGDLVAPSTLNVVVKHHMPIHVIHGNNKGDLTMLAKLAATPENHVYFHGQDADITLGGKRIFMVHYPHYAEGMALTGRYDLVCCGHTHNVRIYKVKNVRDTTTTIVNPGNTARIGEDPHLVMADLATMDFEIIKLEHESQNN